MERTDARQAPAPAGAAPDPEARRLLWRCRRGMKELDVILERFAREALPLASKEERGALAELLALPDPLLAGYLLGETTPADPRLASLAARIRDLCRSGVGSGVFCP
jgi:antitoxin CptB